MASKKQKQSKKDFLYILIIIVLVVALISIVLYKGDLLSLLLDGDIDNNEHTSAIYTSFYSKNTSVHLPDEFDINSLLEVHFIDVGQGDSILIRFPDENNMLIDAGSGTSASNATKTKFKSYLSDMDMIELNYLLITHPDSDHVNLAYIALEEYQVNNVYYNDLYDGQSKTYKNFVDLSLEEDAELFAIGENGAYYSFYSAQYNYKMDIFAMGHNNSNNANQMSIICLLQYHDIKILFTGDALVSTEDYLMEQFDTEHYHIDILKVAHHGSDTSSSTAFFEFFTPDYAVISVGETNTYNHPHPLTMNKLFNYGIVTYRTNRHGNIVLYVDAQGNFAFLPEKNVPIENNLHEKDEKRLVFGK